MSTKSKTTHTPGPWAVKPSPHMNEWRAFIEDTGEKAIAAVNFRCETGDESWANARLIAAAPKLLEACKLLDDSMRPGGAIGYYVDQTKTTQYRTGIDAIRAAIAKAESA